MARTLWPPDATPAPSCLRIEREPERGIEVERRALVPGFLPGLLAKGRAGVVEAIANGFQTAGSYRRIDPYNPIAASG